MPTLNSQKIIKISRFYVAYTCASLQWSASAQASPEHPLPLKRPRVYRQCFCFSFWHLSFWGNFTHQRRAVFLSAPFFQPPSEADTISVNWPSPLGFDWSSPYEIIESLMSYFTFSKGWGGEQFIGSQATWRFWGCAIVISIILCRSACGNYCASPTGSLYQLPTSPLQVSASGAVNRYTTN